MLDFLINYSGVILTLYVWTFLSAYIFFTKNKQKFWTETISESTTKNKHLDNIFSIVLFFGGIMQIIFSFFLFYKTNQNQTSPFILFMFLGFLVSSGAYLTKKKFPIPHYIISVAYFILLPVSFILIGSSFHKHTIYQTSIILTFIYCLGCLYFMCKKYLGTYFEVFVFLILGLWSIAINYLLF